MMFRYHVLQRLPTAAVLIFPVASFIRRR